MCKKNVKLEKICFFSFSLNETFKFKTFLSVLDVARVHCTT